MHLHLQVSYIVPRNINSQCLVLIIQYMYSRINEYDILEHSNYAYNYDLNR